MSEVDEDGKAGVDLEMADINVTVPSDRTETDDIIIKDNSETRAEPVELSPLDSPEQQAVDSRSRSFTPPQVRYTRCSGIQVYAWLGSVWHPFGLVINKVKVKPYSSS